jgi:hypothetical protein
MNFLRTSSLFGLLLPAALGLAPLGCSASVTPTSTGTGGSSSTSTGTGGSGGGEIACVGADACKDLDDACNTGACVNGKCDKLPAHEGASCDDGKACSMNDSCHEGACVPGSLKFCPSEDSCHVGSCDLDLDACVQIPGNDGASCNDTDACTLPGTCSGGTCLPGGMIDCSFLDDTCSVGICDPALGCKVSPKAEGAPCEDGLFCTIGDTCKSGICSGAPNPCAPPENVCLVGSCNELMSVCTAVPGNEGLACDDGSLCTGGETCSAGQCTGGVPANEGVACSDGDGCTNGTQCQNGQCANPSSVIMACIDGDSCCPPGCDADLDCKSTVLIIASDDPEGSTDVQSKLVATGAFTKVDVFDAAFDTPSVAQLGAYQAVLLYVNMPLADPGAMGDRLADYFDGGGRVVIAPGANCDPVKLEGRFVDQGYLVLDIGAVDESFPSDSLGLILEPNSPLVEGVNMLDAPFAARCFVSPTPGSTVVAQWGAGIPLIARGLVQGRKRVDLNFFPPSAEMGMVFWTGDGAAILKDALLYK